MHSPLVSSPGSESVKLLFIQLEHEIGQYVEGERAACQSASGAAVFSDADHSAGDRAEILAHEQRINSLFLKGGMGTAQERQRVDKLRELRQEFGRARRRIEEAWQRADLVGVGRGQGSQTRQAEDLARERAAIMGADSMADSILGQAREAQLDLESQSQTVAGSRGKLSRVANAATAARGTIGSMIWRKRRDSIIIGLLVGLLLCFLFWWWWTSH
eukprot:m51a1_g11888 putative C-tail anchored protein, C-terminal SNARE domain (216) ;mRNA; f:590604-591569